MYDFLRHSFINGPQGLQDRWTSSFAKGGLNFSDSAAIVLELVDRLRQHQPQLRYTVWIDNYFTSARLFSQLRDTGIGASGTVKNMEKGTGLDKRLVALRNQLKDSIGWGRLYAAISRDGKLLQLGWKDNVLVLFMTTTFNGKEKVASIWKRPRDSSSSKASRAIFGDDIYKLLAIPLLTNLYNYCVNGVDIANQAKCYYTTQRRHCKGWKTL